MVKFCIFPYLRNIKWCAVCKKVCSYYTSYTGWERILWENHGENIALNYAWPFIAGIIHSCTTDYLCVAYSWSQNCNLWCHLVWQIVARQTEKAFLWMERNSLVIWLLLPPLLSPNALEKKQKHLVVSPCHAKCSKPDSDKGCRKPAWVQITNQW